MNLILSSLEAALAKAGTQRALAEILGTGHSTLSGWKNGVDMPAVDFLKIVEYIGGDASRSMPDWEDDTKGGLTIRGSVSAGLVTFAQADERVIEGPDGPWSTSTYRRLTHGPVQYVQVSGNSMEPDFPDGCILACAKPSAKVPDMTPVIARVDDEMTFKLMAVTKDRRGKPEVELIPLNRTFRVARYAPEEVAVDYVVLGFINPWKRGVVSEPKAPVMREVR